MKIVWERVLIVKFKSALNKTVMEFGNNLDNRNLIIEISGHKYLSSLKDEFVIDIFNLTYSEVAKLLLYKYDQVEVFAGYKSSGVHKIFDGKILYISNERESRETSIVHIICVSKLLGLYNSKLNLTMNSGINMYAALDFICKRAGIPNSNISEEFKRQFLTSITNVKGSLASYLDTFTTNATTYGVQSDSSNGSIVSIWDLKRSDARLINIKLESGMIIKGYPTLTTDGIRFSSLPVFNYMPGDTLLLDNRLIDMSITNVEQATESQLGLYLDANNKYVIYELTYNLTNGGGAFDVKILSKSKSLLLNVIGS